MTVNFQIDRVDPPLAFYTPVEDAGPAHLRAGADILVECAEHPSLGMMTLGLVTRQTPFGQCLYRGVSYREVRIATPDEVRAALGRDNERGTDFVPEIMPHMSTVQYWYIKKRWKSIAARQREAILQNLPYN